MKEIKLNINGTGRFVDKTPFPIGDLKLIVTGLPNTNGEFRFVAHCNGVKCAQKAITTADSVIDISQASLSAGSLTSYVGVYLNGQEIQRYNIEPLTITQVNGAFVGAPEIAALETKCAELDAENEEIKSDLAKAQKGIAALTEFALKVFDTVPYFDTADKDNFIKAMEEINNG